MKIGEIYRYGRPYNRHPEIIETYKNYFYETYTENQKYPLLESGINGIQEIKCIDGIRRPAVLISSSPHKIGTLITPWQDYFDPDNGHIRYYGDNKRPDQDPSLSPGNKLLLECYKKHSSDVEEMRKESVPLIFFRRTSVNKKVKGFIQFQGFGIIRSIKLISQYDRKNNRTFPNIEFDFVVFSIVKEHENFSWDWISKRRDSTKTILETHEFAPDSWKVWTKEGVKALDKCSRRVSKLHVKRSSEQIPPKGSKEAVILTKIYNHYSETGSKKRFEVLASKVAASIIKVNCKKYIEGWITPSSRDGGADFIGRIDIGDGIFQAKLIVLGQAKCEKLSSPTGGNHIARTVARLKRGWLGVYVTTSYFSEIVQSEIIEDEYPILLVNGYKLAQEILKILHEENYSTLEELLKELDRNYELMIKQRKPEEILSQ